jgi:hypothetical protein
LEDMHMMRIASAVVFLSSLASAVGCSAGGEESDQDIGAGTPLETTTTLGLVNENAGTLSEGETDKDFCVFNRNDVQFRDIPLGNGPFASLSGCGQVCPANSFVYSVFTQAETNQGGGDDTALNGIWFACFNRVTGAFTAAITSNTGPFGAKPFTAGGAVDLPKFARCTTFTTGNPIKGGQMVIEGNQGTGVDDTAANRVFLTCKNGQTFMATPAPTNFGNPTLYRECPEGTAVCGINTAVEGNQGGGDDTTLNDAAIHCCTF